MKLLIMLHNPNIPEEYLQLWEEILMLIEEKTDAKVKHYKHDIFNHEHNVEAPTICVIVLHTPFGWREETKVVEIISSHHPYDFCTVHVQSTGVNQHSVLIGLML